jgi:hypothetical protein
MRWVGNGQDERSRTSLNYPEDTRFIHYERYFVRQDSLQVPSVRTIGILIARVISCLRPVGFRVQWDCSVDGEHPI